MKVLKFCLTLLIFLTALSLHAQRGKADKMFDRYDFYRAIPTYNKYLKKNPNDQEARENLAYCYRMVKDYTNAEAWYSRVCKARNVNPDNRLFYAEALIANGKHKKAVPQLEMYLKERDWNTVAKSMLASAKDQEQYYQDSTLHYVSPVNINTPGPEFGPVIYKNTVIFASPSDRDKVVYNWTGDKFLDLWVAPYDGTYKLGEPVPMIGAVNSRYHEGGATFTPDGNEMYFTRNNYFRGKIKKDENRVVRLKSYKAELVNGKWSNISEFPFNSDEYSVGHPCVNREGTKIYFVSDMPGGSGGTDIWMSKKKGDGWGKPTNLGDKINSPGDEMFPWVSSTGVLYYASNGKGGIGGLDIFRVTSLGAKLEKVHNMGYPVNSPHDDFSLVVDEKTGQGFFTSNRKGGKGDDDLYSFRQKQLVEGLVLDAETGEPIASAKVEVFNPRGIAAVAFSDEEGRFRIGLDRNANFMMVGDAETYLEAQIRINTTSFDPKVPMEALIKLPRDLDCEAPFALDGTIMTEDSTPVIWDDATVRVIPKEFTVLPNEDGKYALSLQPEMDYEIRIEKPGYMDRTVNVSTKDKDPGTLTLETILADLSPDTSMYKIFYDYDDDRIRSYAYKELDKVVGYMNRNPAVKIRLVSHADSRGTTYYNDRLSKNRTLVAYEYLRMEGIDKNRLELVWVGERKPANDCGDGVPCPEEDHQLNRRTDIQYGGMNEGMLIELPTLAEEDVDKEIDDDGQVTKAEREGNDGKMTKDERTAGDDGVKPNKVSRDDNPVLKTPPANEVVKEEVEETKTEMKVEAPEVEEKVEVVEETKTEMKIEAPKVEEKVEVVEETKTEMKIEVPKVQEKVEVVEETKTEMKIEAPKVEEKVEEAEVIVKEETTKKPVHMGTMTITEGEDTTAELENVVDDVINNMENNSDSTRSMEIEVIPNQD